MSKYPLVGATSAAACPSTSRTSGWVWCGRSSPRTILLISLSLLYVLKVASTQRSQPKTSSASGSSPPRSARETGIPMICWALRSSSCMGLVQCRLQGLDVALAGVGRAGHHVDLGALRLECLAAQDGHRVGGDLLIPRSVAGELERHDLGQLAALDRDPYLDGAELGLDDRPVDGLCALRRAGLAGGTAGGGDGHGGKALQAARLVAEQQDEHRHGHDQGEDHTPHVSLSSHLEWIDVDLALRNPQL